MLALVAAGALVASAGRADVATVDTTHAYGVEELIAIALASNPEGRAAEERQVRREHELGAARSEYVPTVAAQAALTTERVIGPFPRSIAPAGYAITQVGVLTPELTFQYLLLDFGGRGGRVDAARAAEAAARADFVRENQVIAFAVAAAFYRLITEQEALEAARQALATSQVTLQAAQARLATGRVTAPDVLNAKAAAAQANFDLQSATGAESIARIALREVIGAEPSPEIQVAPIDPRTLPRTAAVSVNELLDRAARDRPDLQSLIASVRQQDALAREAKATFFPTAFVSGAFGRTWEVPRDDGGELGAGSAWTWAAGLEVRVVLFDGVGRTNRLEAVRARERELESDVRRTRDRIAREVWTGYVGFVTATHKEEAATALLEAATSSFAASLDSYRLGVRDIVDVVAAQRQLATARLASVSARSELLVAALDLELVTGNLLRSQTRLTRPSAAGGPP